MTKQEALTLINQLIEQTRLLPADYRKLQEAMKVLADVPKPEKPNA